MINSFTNLESEEYRKNEFFMRQALKQAQIAARKNEAPIGAVVVLDGKIIARGHNNREAKHNITGHAEIIAIQKAAKKLGSWKLNNCDLYVTLEPCCMCAGAIQQSRIRTVYFGTTDPKGGAIVSLTNIFDLAKLNHKVAYCGGILADECSKILSDFFYKLRKNK